MFDTLIGKHVIYVSASKKEYVAKIVAIPPNPGHKYTCFPTVSLEFRDERGKLVRKERVVPEYAENPLYTDNQIWRIGLGNAHILAVVRKELDGSGCGVDT